MKTDTKITEITADTPEVPEEQSVKPKFTSLIDD